MPHSNDEPRDLKSRLSRFNLFESTPRDQIEPRDPVFGAIKDKITLPHGMKGPGMLGWEDVWKKDHPICRWCGTEMYFYEERETEIVYACPYPMCENNPNTPDAIKNQKRAKRSMNTKQDHW